MHTVLVPQGEVFCGRRWIKKNKLGWSSPEFLKQPGRRFYRREELDQRENGSADKSGNLHVHGSEFQPLEAILGL